MLIGLWWARNSLFLAKLSFEGDLGCRASLLDSAEMGKCSGAMPAITLTSQNFFFHQKIHSYEEREKCIYPMLSTLYILSVNHTILQPILVRYAVMAKSDLKLSLLKLLIAFPFSVKMFTLYTKPGDSNVIKTHSLPHKNPLTHKTSLNGHIDPKKAFQIPMGSNPVIIW